MENHMDDPRRFVAIDEHHFISDEKLTDFAIKRGIVDVSKLEPIGDAAGKALSDILIPRCQARLRKMLKDSVRRIENGKAPFNRAQRRALKKRKRR